MVENIIETTRVTRARKDTTSLRSTIPVTIARLLCIKEGDDLEWSIGNDYKIHITIKKAA